MAAYEVLLLNTTLPQIQAAQAGDTYVVPRDITFSTNATFTTGTANGVMYLNGDKVVSTGSLLTFNGTTFTAPSLSLTNALSTTSGGTGLSSFTAGDLTYYSTGTALSKLAIGTANQVLTSSGTAPQWTSLSSIGVTSVSFGSTGLTPSSATAGAVSVAGTLVTSNGGTGLSSYTAGDLVYYSTGTALSKLAIGTASQILTSSGSAPQWSTASGISVGTATNLAGGAAGSVPYQSGAGATTFLSIGAANQVLTSTGSAPQWVTSLTGLTGVSSSSITNTALTSGRVVYSTTGGAQTDSASLTFDGTTFATTTVDTTNLEVTNIKAKDGTAAASIADSTGVVTVTAAPVMSALTASQAVFTTAGKALTSNPITGTGNVVMSASPTLTGTIAAAAVTLSSDLTLSGGTANGVLYLNGSKVATSGSALTFDGTNLGVLAGSVTTPAAKIHAVGSVRASTGTGTVYTQLANDGVYSTGTDLYLFAPTGYANIFYANNAEQMRLTSTGLGIGTTSPSVPLHVQANASGYALILKGRSAGGNEGWLQWTNNAGTVQAGIYSTSDNLVFANTSSNTERMRIDSSGNLLVNTTTGGSSNTYSKGSLLLGGTIITAGYKYCVINYATGGNGSALSYQKDGAEKAAMYFNDADTRLYVFNTNSATGVYMTNGATSWTANSDERLKTDLKPIENAVEKVSTLRAVTGRFKTDEEGVSRAFLIAQDVEAVLPEAVSKGAIPKSEDTTEYLGISYTETIPLLVAAIKELKTITDAQTTRIQSLTARIAALESKGV